MVVMVETVGSSVGSVDYLAVQALQALQAVTAVTAVSSEVRACAVVRAAMAA
jgi:hypothetical protein